RHADLRQEHCDEFLAHRRFDAVKDQRGFHCDTPLCRASTSNWPFLDGVDDECTASALLQWIQADPRSPYFAVLWTMMTHYPYFAGETETDLDRKSTRLNSSHDQISYAVFCLKKKNIR